MPAKAKASKTAKTAKTAESILEDEIMNMNEDEPEEYNMEEKPQSDQRILKLNDFIKDMIEDATGAALVEIFYFADKVLKYENFIKNSNTIYQQPVFVKISNDKRKPLKGYGLAKLKEKYGENFGISYSITQRRQLQDENVLNLLRVDVRQEKSFKGYSYYDMKNFAASAKDTAANKIKEIYYEDAQIFKKLITKTTNYKEYEDEDVDFIKNNI
jgi:hypothetical protein